MENTKGEELFWLNLSGYKDRGVRATSVYPLFFYFVLDRYQYFGL
jgi:hypothetical protein